MTKKDVKPEDDESEEKMSIHERTGKFNNTMTIYDIEKAFHPRSKEIVREELTSILDKFVNENVDKSGNIKNPEKAVDAFLELLAKYHFGEELYEDLKGNNKKHMMETLREKYGVRRESLRKAFTRKGAYRTRDAFYSAHRDPLVDRVDEVKKQNAQESLNIYLNNEDARGEIPEHLETRTGKKLSDSYRKILDLEKTVQLIASYMSLPGAVEAIEEDKKAKLNLPDAQAGHPSIYDVFDKGDKFLEAYHKEAENVDGTHRLKSKKKDAA